MYVFPAHFLPVFHHDSPYDACSPQFNRGNNRKAPINAFDRSEDPITNALLEHHRMREEGQMHETPVDLPNGQEDYESRDPYAVPQSMGYDGPTDADNPNSEYFGVASEPWQEFSNPIKSAHNAGRSKITTGGTKAENNFEDMETILRGGRQSEPRVPAYESVSQIPASQAEPESTKYNHREGRRPSLFRSRSISRSKSLASRFRRHHAEPEPLRQEPPAPVPSYVQIQQLQPATSGQTDFLMNQGLAPPIRGASNPAPVTTAPFNQPEANRYLDASPVNMKGDAPNVVTGIAQSSYMDEPAYVYGSAYTRLSRRHYTEAPEPPPKQTGLPVEPSSLAQANDQLFLNADAEKASRTPTGSAGPDPLRRGLRRLASIGRSRSRRSP